MMSLFHVFFENKAPELKENYNTYKSLLKERDSIETLLISQLNKNEITASEFSKKFYDNKSLYKKKIKACNAEKREISTNFSFNGRKSFHYWLFVFGLSFSFFILSIRHTYKQLLHYKLTNKSLRKSQVFEAAAWISVSLFWVIHSVFISKADLPKPMYALMMFTICLLIGFSIYYIIKYLIENKYTQLEKYRKSISRLVALISDIRLNHYFLMAAKAQSTHGKEEVEKDVEIVEEKIFTTIEKVADES